MPKPDIVSTVKAALEFLDMPLCIDKETGRITCAIKYCPDPDFIEMHVMKLYNRITIGEIYNALVIHMGECEH